MTTVLDQFEMSKDLGFGCGPAEGTNSPEDYLKKIIRLIVNYMKGAIQNLFSKIKPVFL